MQFFDKTIPVNEHIIKRLNDIFDFLICKDYDDIRKYRLVEPIYPRDIMVAAKLSPALDERENNLESFFIMKDGQIISNAKREEINQYYLVRIENIQHLADAAEELTILSKNTQNQVIVKMKKEAYEDMVERNGNSFRHRSWQLIDEYYFVMHKENHT